MDEKYHSPVRLLNGFLYYYMNRKDQLNAAVKAFQTPPNPFALCEKAFETAFSPRQLCGGGAKDSPESGTQAETMRPSAPEF